ncbi:hypothetical protein [Kangiella shandongensis]|uniref:hypothetical protein n=1 Tax=Kangiella shandongensis TaxID=2763258 RepID=UPI001CBC352B|nr:hypothetical protein [Kangiella shandongensis]
MKRIIALAFATLVLLTVGCASKLSNFSKKGVLQPEESMGIVVIAYESDTSIHSLIFSGSGKYKLEHTLYDNDHNFVVTSMPAGTYDITRVKIYNKYNFISLGSNQDENWKINIEPNKINYIGHFSINRIGRGYRVQTKNSSTLALDFLKNNFNELLKRYPLVYAKDGPEDEFFEYVENLKGEKNDT